MYGAGAGTVSRSMSAMVTGDSKSGDEKLDGLGVRLHTRQCREGARADAPHPCPIRHRLIVHNPLQAVVWALGVREVEVRDGVGVIRVG